MNWNRKTLIKAYLDFFKSKSHKEIPNASLIPEHDPTVLFTTAGMHPLVPFLLGHSHPLGKKLVNVQKCIRTVDIDEVGDESHHTFFEMLGNWSLGDYWKKQTIEYSLEFLTKILKIPKEKISVTCFKGDKDAPKDKESQKIWESLGIPSSRIKFLPKSDNWWGPAGESGPCGPDTEMFVSGFEIWNDVFMQYNKTDQGKFLPLKQKNVDTGMGVERTTAILNSLDDDYLTDSFLPIIKQIEKISGEKYGKNERETRHMRIIADHIKASVMIIADGITPSNTEQGYVLRRLIRRAIRYGYILKIKNSIKEIALPVFKIYSDYLHLQKNKKVILEELEKEEQTFEKALEEGIKAAKKIFGNKIPLTEDKNEKIRNSKESIRKIMEKIIDNKNKGEKYNYKPANLSEKEIDQALITGKDAFLLYQSYGFPEEMILEMVVKQRLLYDEKGFKQELSKHQEKSRTATQGKFKSGLADNSQATAKLHTATHLLNQALRIVLNKKDIYQKGSNITPERLRFDFNFDRKLTEKELAEVENLVNSKIKAKLPIKCEITTLEKAKQAGAQGVFEHKYGDKINVYSVGEFSKEICAGPHVSNTSELGKFKIVKEESVAAGVRRIKAILI